jgi:hypothetical protein
VPAAILYLCTDRIGGVGGPRTLEGVDLGGDLVGGFGIGDADVTIWGGLYGVGPLALLWCQGSLRVPSQYISVLSLSVAVFILLYSALQGFSLCSQAFSLPRTVPTSKEVFYEKVDTLVWIINSWRRKG